jgi:hypothetical protein
VEEEERYDVCILGCIDLAVPPNLPFGTHLRS